MSGRASTTNSAGGSSLHHHLQPRVTRDSRATSPPFARECREAGPSPRGMPLTPSPSCGTSLPTTAACLTLAPRAAARGILLTSSTRPPRSMSRLASTLVREGLPLERARGHDTDRRSAREHNIRVVVKSSGHDYMGRSIAPGALSIWTRHLNGVKFHPGSFRLGGSARVIKGSSMTVGGGVSTYEAYKAADKHHQTIVGGNDGSVSFGGYITGGGHSYTAPHYGLAADNVLELEVVTPTGRILTVNEDRHPDLFWALRGVRARGSAKWCMLTSLLTHIRVAARPLASSPRSPCRRIPGSRLSTSTG